MMGIDAEIGFRAWRNLTHAEIKDLQYHLLHRFGGENGGIFWTHYNGRDKPPVDFIYPVDILEQDGGPDIKAQNLYQLRLFCRYYGPGYERGPAMSLIGTLLYLVRHPLVADVYYFGDSSGICAEHPMTEDSILGLLSHYIKHGSFPHNNAFDHEQLDNRPSCSYCEKPMLRNGWGGRYAHFCCQGCGQELVFRDATYDAWMSGVKA